MERTQVSEHPNQQYDQGGRRDRWIFIAFAAIALFFILAEHRAHAIEYLPFLLLAACPLLHFFHGHGGHRGHGGHGENERGKDRGKDGSGS